MANANINTGPIIQFWIKDRPRILVLRNTCPNSSYFTFVKGGYIITINPIAIGILVVPEDILPQNFATDGNIHPENIPMNMARNIHNVRYLSRNLRRVFIIAV
jgi:hypothetical protein